MPALFVSSFIVLGVELGLFGLLWIQNPTLNLAVIIGHFTTALLAAFWFSSCRNHPMLSTWQTRIFVASLIGFLPVIGSVFLPLIDNHKMLRAYGRREGLGSKEKIEETAQDSLNYFSAPEYHTKGNIRNTRDLISSLDDDNYLGLLIASRHLPDKEAYALLSEALFSPFESARLMAYSLRGKLEDKLSDSLEQKILSLKSATSSQQKAELHLALAKDYIHILDIGIESRDKDSLMAQAKGHCILALKLDSKSSTGFKTLSKVLKYQGNANQAKRAAKKAYLLAAA